MDNSILTKAVWDLAKEYRKKDASKRVDVDKIVEIVQKHSLGAAASGLGSGWLPGAGSLIAAGVAAGFVWSMYYRINQELGIQTSKNLLKTIASAVLVNIGQYVAVLISASIALSFIPVGNIGASVIIASLNYAAVLTAGVVYMKLMISLIQSGRDISGMTEEELKKATQKAASEIDVKGMLKSAQSEYKRARKSGEVTGDEECDVVAD